MSWQLTKNLAASTLASGYTAGDSSISVQSGDGAKFPTTGNFMLAFNDPPDFFLRCTARSTDTLTVDTSGAEGSTAGNEGSGVKVTQVITAGVLSALCGLVLLEQHTASSSAELDFTTWYSSAYDEYEIHLIDVVPASNNVTPELQFSTDGGSTYDTSGIYYSVRDYRGITVSDNGTTQYGGQGQIYLGGNDLGNTAANGGLSGVVHLFNPQSAVTYKRVIFDLAYASQNGYIYRCPGAGVYKSATAVNALRILFSSGNIASGTIRVYGLAK